MGCAMLRAMGSQVMGEEYMERAIELARAGMNRGEGGPFGAVVVRDGEVLGEGWNQVLATNDPTAHGEVVAIRDACRKIGSFSLEGSEIFTTGQPCPMCLGAIYWARIGKIHFGFDLTDAARIGFDDREFFRQVSLEAVERKVPEGQVGQVGKEMALELLEEYMAMPDRESY